MAKALEVARINVYRGGVHVLRSVSIDVEIGEVVLVAGRNGAGKTALIKSVLGMLKVERGR